MTKKELLEADKALYERDMDLAVLLRCAEMKSFSFKEGEADQAARLAEKAQGILAGYLDTISVRLGTASPLVDIPVEQA